MSEKPRGFVLAPSRLGSQGRTSQEEDKQGGTRPNFTGLKESKLGLLVESKLTPSSGSVSGSNKSDGATAGNDAQTKSTFSFTPLTRPKESSDDENKPPTEDNDVEKEKKSDSTSESKLIKPVFGENLVAKAVLPTEEKETKPDKNEVPVFGQNLADRAVIDEESSTTESPKKVFTPSSTSLLFSSAVPKSPDDDGEKKTLSESAAEYTESHESNKRKYDVVDVVTGEEEESNVLQANGKLYLFDTQKRNWTERGRGQFRLNDDPVSEPGHLKSRLVMRTVGSLRVVLNTKLWADMICEKADEKKVRISAFEEGEVKIFLIATSPKDADKLFTALEYRITQLKQDREENGGEPPEKKSAPSKDDEA